MNQRQVAGAVLTFLAGSGPAIAALFPSQASPWILGASGLSALALGTMHHQAQADPAPAQQGTTTK